MYSLRIPTITPHSGMTCILPFLLWRRVICRACSARFSLHKEHHQIGTVYHFTVTLLVCSLEVAACRGTADLHLIVVIMKGVLIVPVLRRLVGHDPDKGAVIITDRPLAASHRQGNELVKFSVTADKELHIFLFGQQLADQLFKLLLDRKGVVDHPVPEEGQTDPAADLHKTRLPLEDKLHLPEYGKRRLTSQETKTE